MRCKTIKFLFFLFLVFLVGCGRKQRNIFTFSKTREVEIKKLVFPAVRKVNVTLVKHKNFVSWLPVVGESSESIIGYNIYCLNSMGVIPKTPLNKNIIQETQFTDVKKSVTEKQIWYLVKAVFKIKNKILEGPASRIVSIN